MKRYVGVKVIEAEPMVKDGIDGYKVIYDNPNNTKYESWSPKEVFEGAYTEISIDQALTDNVIIDIFSETNKKFGQFMPQQYVWLFLEECRKQKITFQKET